MDESSSAAVASTSSGSKPSNLILLPALPAECPFEVFRAAYEPALNAMLTQEASDPLVVGFGVTRIASSAEASAPGPLGVSPSPYVKIVGNVFKGLIKASVGARAKDKQETDGPAITVVLVAAPDEKPQAGTGSASLEQVSSAHGPVLGMERLARPQHPWQQVFYPDTAPGRALFSRFQNTRSATTGDSEGSRVTGHPLPASTTPSPSSGDGPQCAPQGPASKPYLTVAVGGTFDHLHLGHRLLLTGLALTAAPRDGPEDDRLRRLIVGITGDALLKNKKFGDLLEPWDQRQAAVARFLNAIGNFDQPFEELSPRVLSEPGPNGHAVHYGFQGGVSVECVEIADAFGPTVTDETIEALVVSGETRAGGKAVIDKRQALGWPTLDIVEVDVLDARAGEDVGAEVEDFANKISSTAIRQQLAERKHKAAETRAP